MSGEDAPVLVTPLPNGMKVAFRDRFHVQRDLLTAELDQVVNAKPAFVLIDLAAVESIASEGLGRLVFFRNRITSAGGTVKTVGVNPFVLEVMNVTRVGPVLGVDTGA